MMSPDFRPKLAAKARLRYDRHSDRHMLLYPEKGLALNATGTEIVKLCTGEQTVREIIASLSARYDGAPTEKLEQEVLGFLEALLTRGLLEVTP
jgi:coenzyme PQQ biosynthesis protein PqqD